MGNFLALTTELFKYACELNAAQNYTWHKNLQVRAPSPRLSCCDSMWLNTPPPLFFPPQVVESELNMVKHHIERAVAVISRIDTDHLDYESQLKRLQDVAERFDPLMERLDTR
jgi:hypothetical protein